MLTEKEYNALEHGGFKPYYHELKGALKAQRDLTASIKDAEWKSRLETEFCKGYREAVDDSSIRCQARIEALIEEIDNLIIGVDGCEFEKRLDGDKGCLVLDMNQNQWDEFRATKKGGEG